MNNNTEFSGIAEQAVEEETLLPEEQAQFDDIVANAAMKKIRTTRSKTPSSW